MTRVYPPLRCADMARRYLTAAGTSPYECEIRTPAGHFRPLLDTRDHLITVNEIFAREDYRIPTSSPSPSTSVPMSAWHRLYFLTRNDSSCLLPRDSRFSGRYELHALAAAGTDGEPMFYTEPTGRYGGRRPEWRKDTPITVRTRSLDDSLGEVAQREARIDVLNVDTEGTEADLVGSIAPGNLQRIDRIYYETVAPTPLHLEKLPTVLLQHKSHNFFFHSS